MHLLFGFSWYNFSRWYILFETVLEGKTFRLRTRTWAAGGNFFLKRLLFPLRYKLFLFQCSLIATVTKMNSKADVRNSVLAIFFRGVPLRCGPRKREIQIPDFWKPNEKKHRHYSCSFLKNQLKICILTRLGAQHYRWAAAHVFLTDLLV